MDRSHNTKFTKSNFGSRGTVEFSSGTKSALRNCRTNSSDTSRIVSAEPGSSWRPVAKTRLSITLTEFPKQRAARKAYMIGRWRMCFFGLIFEPSQCQIRSRPSYLAQKRAKRALLTSPSGQSRRFERDIGMTAHTQALVDSTESCQHRTLTEIPERRNCMGSS